VRSHHLLLPHRFSCNFPRRRAVRLHHLLCSHRLSRSFPHRSAVRFHHLLLLHHPSTTFSRLPRTFSLVFFSPHSDCAIIASEKMYQRTVPRHKRKNVPENRPPAQKHY
jgi:hypothetical protein